ncbi:MAG: hypothetical protein RLP02_11100 [Coleofasciculus sp. C2-GNP5-27]
MGFVLIAHVDCDITPLNGKPSCHRKRVLPGSCYISLVLTPTAKTMNAIQLQVLPHQTQTALPYQHLHFQIATEDGILSPPDIKGIKLPEGIPLLKT